mgnify:CR=1 FL=1
MPMIHSAPGTSTRRLALVVALTLMAAGGAKAQLNVTAEQRAACTPDALRLCSAAIPNVARVTACMKAHEADLSAGCRAVFRSAGTTPPQRDAPVYQARQHGGPTRSIAAAERHPPAAARWRHVARLHHRPSYADDPGAFLRAGGWMHAREAQFAARQIMTGLGWACENQQVPADVCAMSTGLIGAFGQ